MLFFVQPKQSWFPQLSSLIRHVFQTLHPLNCPSLNAIQHLRVLFEVRGQNWRLYLRCGLISVEYRDKVSPLVLLTPLFLIQASMPLVFLATHLAHSQLAVNQHPQVPFC